ncbi:MAG TPA: SDR family oxidoreductase [Thermomicrobiales bacterium]|nr:SDR family oxidoreductase [Thermomicrobiales bacterium]
MILVTGGAGYIGSVLVGELLGLGQQVRVVDTMWFGDPFAPHERLQLIQGDLRTPDASWLKDVDAVIHLAGLSNDPTADFAPALNNESNVYATRQLAQLAAEKSKREDREIRYLFASTCSVYYAPTTADSSNVITMTEDMPIAPTANYSKTKRLAEVELLRIADQYPRFTPVMLRKGTIFGLSPRMRFDLVVNVFTLHAWRNRQLTVHGHGEAWRPLLHIRDAVDAYIHLLSAPTDKIRGEAFNVIHKNYRVLELAHWVTEVLDQRYGVDVRVKRNRTGDSASRSYFVSGDKIAERLGFSADRGVADAVITMWDALERGDFGLEPENDPRYFNIRWLKDTLMAGAPA